MFQQTTVLKYLFSAAIFMKIEDHFEQNQHDRLRENSQIGPQNWPRLESLQIARPR